MTKTWAVQMIKKHVKSCGGTVEYLSIRSTKCGLWKRNGNEKTPKRNCYCFGHPVDCPGGKPVCRVEYFKPISDNCLGLPGFIEIVADTSDWDSAVRKILARKFWG